MRMARAKRGVVRDAWSMARVYWASEEKWSAWGLLLAVVALNLGTVCTSVGINAWNRGFYNALQAFDRGQIFRPLGDWGVVHIPGYLVWQELLYAGIGTWLTVRVGRPLVQLNFAGQRFEGVFRFSLARLRENAESVASYGREPVELGVFQERFRNIFANFRNIMGRQMRLNWFTQGYAQVAVIFPLLVVLPRYFVKQIGWGGLMQVASAFSYVYNSLSFIITRYPEIAAWQAATERLSRFQERLFELQESASAPQQIAIRRSGLVVAVDDLDLDLPDGTPLLRGVSFVPVRGYAVMIPGPTGTDKRTFLRPLAAFVPFGRGEIRIGEGPPLFVPQRPSLPLGTLAGALLYHQIEGSSFPAGRLKAVLKDVGLDGLVGELNMVENWGQRLSLGEQQRLGFARILLPAPTLLSLYQSPSP